MTTVIDTLGRPLRDLRVSVTDRCNFRCAYCMPKEAFPKDFAFMARERLLRFGEITSIVKAAVPLGLRKVRLTGGEPLLRKELEWLVKGLREIPEIEDIALTTNGSSLAKKAKVLAEAGLNRVTVSLDSLDDATFRAMNDVEFPVARVLEGIDAAVAAGLTPVKINMVVKRGVNDTHVVELARRFRDQPVIVRFIEFMDVGTKNGWRLEDVVPAAEVLQRLAAEFPLEPLPPKHAGETALRYRHADGRGEVGFIASVTKPFCGACNRARLSADGQLYTCLFATAGHDLRRLLREEDADEARLGEALAAIWRGRDDRYSELRSDDTKDLPKVEMSYIGG
ncbi:MAG: GTP 3',8-cyclase MoaA [Planctomycetota bacterium]|nr:GTP 3',8-cyclase MoaA [Planctomycetota bacterium]